MPALLPLALLLILGQALENPAPPAGGHRLAQVKPDDRGNCFQWKGCRGDSIGNMWVHLPQYCATLGGKSWMDENGQCHNLPEGPQGW